MSCEQWSLPRQAIPAACGRTSAGWRLLPERPDMTYDEVVSSLKTMLAVELNDEDANFTRIIPSMMLYADGRIYREIPFLATKITQPVTLIANNREFQLPSNVRVL